jgi:hypothetical protein
MNNNQIELLLMVTMILFAIVTAVGMGIGLYFQFSRNAAFKRRWFTRVCALWMTVFLILSNTMVVLRTRDLKSLRFLVVEVPFVALILYLGVKNTRFCDHCGRTVNNPQWPFRRVGRYCPYCGAELDPAAMGQNVAEP